MIAPRPHRHKFDARKNLHFFRAPSYLCSKSSDDTMKKTTNPLPRHSLADAVVGRLQQQLSLGIYQPGEKLPSEPELMVQFGVGRSTIREAVRILSNTGLLTVRQGSGTIVES